MPDPVTIHTAVFPDERELVRELLREYADSLGFDLSFQGFDNEMAEMPGRYAEPEGRMLLASHGGAAVGCVGLRPLEAGVCEMKRLYVRPAARGLGAGRALAEAVIAAGRTVGYDRMRLDTIGVQMQAAVALYLQLGFTDIAPYTANPIPGARYLELRLS
jgi:GNAT superfamily N-acetyltransferase